MSSEEWHEDIRDGNYVSEHVWTLASLAREQYGEPLRYADFMS